MFDVRHLHWPDLGEGVCLTGDPDFSSFQGLDRTSAELHSFVGLLGEAGIEFGEVVEVLLHGAVALARPLFQTRHVQQLDFSPVMLDEAGVFEGADDDACTHSSHAKHGGEELLGDVDGGASGAVAAQQQPACQPLLDIVLRVAAGRLGDLRQLSLNTPHGQSVKEVAAGELGFGCRHRRREAVAGNLHVDAVEAAPGAHHCGDAEDGFVAKEAHLHLRAILEGCRHGRNARLQKEQMIDGLPGELDLTANG